MCYYVDMSKIKERFFINLNVLEDDEETISKVFDGLSHPIRVKIIKTLCGYPYVHEFNLLQSKIKVPKTTLIYHLNKLEEAGVIALLYKNTETRSKKLVSKIINSINLEMRKVLVEPKPKSMSNIQEIPVGAYDTYEGDNLDFVYDHELINQIYNNFYDPRHYAAKLIYTKQGIISYKFSNAFAVRNGVDKLNISLEICSEAPYFDNDYKSDITFWLNDVELCTITLKGDYGDRRGKLNPEWWTNLFTQYGELVNISVDKNGVFVKEKLVNKNITIDDLKMTDNIFAKLTLGNKRFALNQGGFNIFGSEFGDYPQEIIIEQIKY